MTAIVYDWRSIGRALARLENDVAALRRRDDDEEVKPYTKFSGEDHVYETPIEGFVTGGPNVIQGRVDIPAVGARDGAGGAEGRESRGPRRRRVRRGGDGQED